MASSARTNLFIGTGIGIGLSIVAVTGFMVLTQGKQDTDEDVSERGTTSNEIETAGDSTGQSSQKANPDGELSSISSPTSEDPEEAWKAIIEHSIDDTDQLDSLIQIAQEWVAQDGFLVLSHINQSLSDTQSQEVLNSVISAIAGEEFEEAFEFATTLAVDEQSTLFSAIVKAWSQSEPEAALGALSEIQDQSLKTTLERIVLESWATQEPNMLLERINLVSAELRLFAIDQAILEIARETPLDAINKLDSMQSYAADTSVIDAKIVTLWADLDPDAALTWVMSKADTKHQFRGELLIGVVLNHLVEKDPNQALQVALNQPIPKESRPLEAYVLNLIANSGEVDMAIDMLPQVREEFKVDAYEGIGLSLVRNANSEKVLELAQDLSDAEQLEFFRPVVSVWATFHTENLFDAVQRLPSDDIKSRAAVELIVQHFSRPQLTDAQIDSLRPLLTEEDSAIVAEVEERYADDE